MVVKSSLTAFAFELKVIQDGDNFLNGRPVDLIQTVNSLNPKSDSTLVWGIQNFHLNLIIKKEKCFRMF